MRKPLLLLAALLPLSGLVGLVSISSSAGAPSIAADPAASDSVATACGAGPAPLAPTSFDVMPTMPVSGHLSIRGGCGDDEDDDFGRGGSAEHESGGDSEDD